MSVAMMCFRAPKSHNSWHGSNKRGEEIFGAFLGRQNAEPKHKILDCHSRAQRESNESPRAPLEKLRYNLPSPAKE